MLGFNGLLVFIGIVFLGVAIFASGVELGGIKLPNLPVSTRNICLVASIAFILVATVLNRKEVQSPKQTAQSTLPITSTISATSLPIDTSSFTATLVAMQSQVQNTISATLTALVPIITPTPTGTLTTTPDAVQNRAQARQAIEQRGAFLEASITLKQEEIKQASLNAEKVCQEGNLRTMCGYWTGTVQRLTGELGAINSERATRQASIKSLDNQTQVTPVFTSTDTPIPATPAPASTDTPVPPTSTPIELKVIWGTLSNKFSLSRGKFVTMGNGYAFTFVATAQTNVSSIELLLYSCRILDSAGTTLSNGQVLFEPLGNVSQGTSIKGTCLDQEGYNLSEVGTVALYK